MKETRGFLLSLTFHLVWVETLPQLVKETSAKCPEPGTDICG